MILVQPYGSDGVRRDIEIDGFPDACPLCHRAIEPLYQKLVSIVEGYDTRLELVFQCPRKKCGSYFIARYAKSSMYSASFRHRESVPFEILDEVFSENIKTISPSFCAVFDQAQKADHQGWKLVAGPGYRKSLEFLIKDYASSLKPEKAADIRCMALSACIANFVDNEKIRAMATRASWVGNDETHYVRKWDEKDLDDLKKLIALTVHWIEMEAITEGMIKEMPEGKA
jgi:hypothetical protein